VVVEEIGMEIFVFPQREDSAIPATMDGCEVVVVSIITIGA
jgi:hypothetical protein